MSWPTVWSQATPLPPHCEPANDFLLAISRTFHTCIPTPLAFASSTLGVISILCWLFAQLPQIYKNWRIGSTSGLSIFFLVEWCLGDLSNLFGAILTNQASWQVCIGAYYVFVDLCLVFQWIWYERLRHGSVVRRIWRKTDHGPSKGQDDALLIEGVQATSEDSSQSDESQKDVPVEGKKTQPKTMFRSFDFGNHESVHEKSLRNSPRTILRHSEPRSMSLSLSPRTVILVVALSALASASPLHTASHHNSQQQQQRLHHHHHEGHSIAILGTALSWTSTILYLLSRLPQLLQNFRRKSVAGLSPLLFAAAFSGNFFYSAALLTNPCAWNDFGSFGDGGWVGAGGSLKSEWVAAALPFFLGAAGVLGLDAAVGVQFVVYGDNGGKVVVENGDASSSRTSISGDESTTGGSAPGAGRERQGKRLKWRRVSGWMRGWIPSSSLSGGSGAGKAERVAQGDRGEREALLGAHSAARDSAYQTV